MRRSLVAVMAASVTVSGCGADGSKPAPQAAVAQPVAVAPPAAAQPVALAAQPPPAFAAAAAAWTAAHGKGAFYARDGEVLVEPEDSRGGYRRCKGASPSASAAAESIPAASKSALVTSRFTMPQLSCWMLPTPMRNGLPSSTDVPMVNQCSLIAP